MEVDAKFNRQVVSSALITLWAVMVEVGTAVYGRVPCFAQTALPDATAAKLSSRPTKANGRGAHSLACFVGYLLKPTE